ncbi:WD40-repeat-containing domain protein [Blyttiomyces helicus]|uniref:WD40-repeat-containing domain protein n=1 Tax=Blyttiomyces helicus TaxID=388810 RepID=A0A4P9WNQ5_9FUNG|nr:WD40-repeat-containing domain protein [Blyttiomyces helicus]|eukprot:RKO92830.1 WD40-repeat-containing domain protein [Blyttiomyces helicus]
MGAKRKSTGTFASASQSTSTAQTAAFELSAFDSPAPDLFAVVSQGIDSHRLRIWDTRTSSLSSDYSGQGNRCTCLAWGFVEEADQQADASGKKKKRRRSSQPPNPAAKVVALGLASGEVDLYSLARGTVVRTLSGGHTSSITDVCFAPDGLRAFSAGEDGHVVEWDLKTGAELSKFKADTKGIAKIRLSHDGQTLLTAGNSIKVWNLESKKVLKTLTGHASNIIRVDFTPDDLICLSAADQDRFISVWDTTAEGPETNVSALTVENPPVSISISRGSHLLSLTEDGVVHLWQSPSAPFAAATEAVPRKKKAKYTARPADGTLTLTADGGDMRLPIYAATFDAEKVLIARGNVVKPVFERLDYLGEDKKILPAISLSRQSTSSLLARDSTVAEQTLKATRKPYNDADAVILGATDVALEVPSALSAAEKSSLAEPTLEERLTSLDLASGDVKSSSSSATRPARLPTASSLHQMLTQAIQAEDRQLLEQALQVSNPSIILSSVRRLPPSSVIPLLDQLLVRMQRRPNRAVDLIEWIRAVVIAHASYLMSVPHLLGQLSTLYQTLDSHVSVFQKLLRLSGRLDLVMSQIAIAGKTEDGQEPEAMVVYDEGKRLVFG